MGINSKLLHFYIKTAKKLHRSKVSRTLYWCVNWLWNGFCRLPYSLEAGTVLDDFLNDGGSSSVLETSRAINSSPKLDLTIIVAAYNVSEYICECLDSILSQKTKYKFEVRVVNDASTDDTGAKIAAYTDSRLKVMTHQHNRGLSEARNTALEGLDSRYLCVVDGDDKLEPYAIESVLNKAYETNADIIEVGFKRFTDDGKIVYTLIPEDNDSSSLESIIGMPTFFVYHSKLFRRIKFPSQYWYEDIIFESLIFLQASRIVSMRAPYYMYRMRSGSITLSLENHKQLDSLYSGKRAILDSWRLGLWSSERNRSYLSDYLCHIIRITYNRIRRNSLALRRSVFVCWRDFFAEYEEELGLLPSSDKERRLIEAIHNGDYRTYELLCIIDYTGL